MHRCITIDGRSNSQLQTNRKGTGIEKFRLSTSEKIRSFNIYNYKRNQYISPLLFSSCRIFDNNDAHLFKPPSKLESWNRTNSCKWNETINILIIWIQNNSYEMSSQKINEIRNVIFGLRYGKPSSALRTKLGCSPIWVLDEI